MSAENPYASPKVPEDDCPDAPDSCGWKLEGKVIKVRKDSLFPMVDPYSGGSEEVMSLQELRIRFDPPLLLLIPLVTTVLTASLASWRGSGVEIVIPVFFGLAAGWIIARLVANFMPICTLRLFFERRTIRRRIMTSRVMACLLIAAVVGNIFVEDALEWVQVIPGFFVLVFLLGNLGMRILTPRLRCRRKSGDWFEIRGFQPRALEQLRREPACRT